MALSPAIREALRRELQVIEAESRKLDAQANAIKRLLGEQHVQPRFNLSGEDQPDQGVVVNEQTSEQPPTFRGCVKVVIGEHPGIRVPDVTRVLRRRGWFPGGSTDLGHRVYNEIWRMAKDGQVRKTESGGYELVQ